jgi:hypothetical protein
MLAPVSALDLALEARYIPTASAKKLDYYLFICCRVKVSVSKIRSAFISIFGESTASALE